MTEQYDEFVKAGAEVVAVVQDREEAARSYFERGRIPFPCLVDPEHGVYDRYEVNSRLLSLGQRPGLFVIDRQGTVRYAYLGWQQWEIPKNGVVLEACRGAGCG